jgi:hypothetical protein
MHWTPFPVPDPLDERFDERPDTYWEDDQMKVAMGRIAGTQRRKSARGYLLGMTSPLADPHAFDPYLPDAELLARGRINPMFMSGEYLPPSEADEVEIARAIYNSTLGDVVSLRARPCGDGISYRVVDEYYESDDDYRISPKSSKLPLTLREVIKLLDEALYFRVEYKYEGGIVYSFSDPYCFENVASRFRPKEMDEVRAVEIESAFYPYPLVSWYGECLRNRHLLADSPEEERACAKSHMIVVTAVKGAARQGVWLHRYMAAFSVETDRGRGYMSEPGPDGCTTVCLGGSTNGRQAIVPPEIMPQVDKHREAYFQIKRQLSKKE